MEKKYVDYVSLIGIFGYSKDFSEYCNKHKKVSIRRNARSFLLKKGKYKEIQHLRQVGFDMSDVIDIARTKWL